MAKGAFRIPVYGGGSSPDPAVYCPTEGFYDPDDPDSPVIWDPLTEANGWFLIAEFDTNSPSTTTFDPVLGVASGKYAWNLGDSTIVMEVNSISHTYNDSTTKRVKVYGKGTLSITSVDFNTDNIVGALNLSNNAFINLTQILLHTNTLMTSAVFPSACMGTVTAIQIYNTGITGTLDLSGITIFSTSATVWLNTNASMTGVTFPSSITGKINSFQIYNTGITGIIDLSGINNFTTTAVIGLYLNALMTGVTFPSSITGTFATVNIYSTGISGTLDLSMFTVFSTSAILNLYSNSSMTGVTFASSITGSISTLAMYSTGISGTLDLSMFSVFNGSSTFNLYSNTALTGVTFPASTITGAGLLITLRLDGCTSLGYVDITKLKTGVNGLSWRFDNCGWTAAIVNRMLVEIDSISVAGFTSRTINIGGTNADPDTTSGGYDGVAARNSLISKGFTVTIT